jgi:HAD superfamily hydrolase (TIGR01490 family)
MIPVRRLAIFDLDHTLLDADSDHLWIEHLGQAGALDHEGHLAISRSFYEQYNQGTLDIQAFLAHQLAPLARHPRSELLRWREECFQQRILPKIGPKARAAVDWHRDRGDTPMLITATCSFVAALAARELGFDHFIGTVAETLDDGSFTGRPTGAPAFREGKITRLHQYLAARGESLSDFLEVWFYSDSRNDIPLLEVATHPVAVDPDEMLLQCATKRGWRIESFKMLPKI